MTRVSVITVNFNHSSVTEALLDSIFNKNTFRDLEVIVVDNGSTDNPVPLWREKYPSVTFIRSERNLGFAGGNNVGIAQARGEYLFFANNDTEFTETLVAELVGTLDEHPDVGMVSPKIRYYSDPNVLQYAGFSAMNYFTARTSCIGQYEKDNGQYDHLTGETGFIHGAAMMVRREAIAKAGLMAENYFLYYEEMDWCDRVRKAGYKIWVNMRSLIYHKESISVGAASPLKEYFMNRNRILFIRRNASALQKMVFWPYFIVVVTPRNILTYLKKGQKGFTSVLLRAIRWNLTHSVKSKDLGYTIKTNS